MWTDPVLGGLGNSATEKFIHGGSNPENQTSLCSLASHLLPNQKLEHGAGSEDDVTVFAGSLASGGGGTVATHANLAYMGC